MVFLIVPLLLAAAPALEAQSDAVAAEQSARRAAAAAIRGSQGPLLEALDADALLQERLTARVWRALTERQRGFLRSALGQRFFGMLAPPRPVPSEIAWSASLTPSGGVVDVLLGLRLENRALKTRWRMRRSESGWRIGDVILSDPGISLAQAALDALGREPVRARRWSREAPTRILPRFAVLAVIGLAVLLAASRVTPARRKFLYLAASIPALVFFAAGVLSIARLLTQPYFIEMLPAGEPWRNSEQLALRAERDGRVEQARQLWARALAAGDPPAPVAYQMGLSAKQRGDTRAAQISFERALLAPIPAPGAARELATLALERGQTEEAERQIARYLSVAGPDPDALSLEAVIKTDLGRTAEALAAIAEARRLVGGGSRGAELEAQIRARAGDAAGAVAALRSLAPERRLDRDSLRADPAYLPIATDPVWVKFLNERLKD